MESSTGQRMFYAAPFNRYMGYYYDAYPMFIDAPIQQDYDGWQLVQNASVSWAAGMTIVIGILTLLSPIPGDEVLFIATMGVTPAVAMKTISDLNAGTVSSLDEYLEVAVKAAIITILSVGIEANIAKVITQVSNPILNFLATTTGGFISGTAVDALSQFITNGEIDWEQAMKSGLYGAAFAASYWAYDHIIKGNPI